MSEQNSGERDQRELIAGDRTLLPPAPEGNPQPPVWAPAPPPAPSASVWNRIAAFLVLIAVVAAAAGAGIGWSLARAVNNNSPRQVAQSTSQPESPITQVTPGAGSSADNTSTDSIAAKVIPAVVDIN